MRPYSDFVDKHSGETIVVCGCGKSTTQLKNPQDFITIGVNDIGRLFCPNYLVILNNKNGFKGDRWGYVQKSEAPVIFTQLKTLDLIHKNNLVFLKLGKFGNINLDDKESVDYTNNSPYVGVLIAYHLGAKKIGMIGVDFTHDHFFSKSGRHPLTGRLTKMVQEYGRLYSALKEKEVEFYNLSSESLITSVPYKNIKDFQNDK